MINRLPFFYELQKRSFENSNDVSEAKGPIASLQHPTFRRSCFTPPSTAQQLLSNQLPLINTSATMVYTLVVHLYAKEDQESINKLIAKLQEASQVYTNDKECLGW
jgi:vacuolar-type H+-ATPase subunit D/Vma8